MLRTLKLILLVLFSFSSQPYLSQNEARNWYFSNNVGLDFSTSPPTLLTNGSMSASAGCSSISGPLGNLLFYTDGMTVWDQNHAIMGNGTGLFGNTGAQNCIIVKKPASSNLYYIFTVQGGGGTAGFNYSIVDMSLSSGNGSVTVKNATLFPSACEEKITAVRHCNQSDVWIMTHEANSGNFLAQLLTSAGVATAVVTSSVGPVHTGASEKGTIKFSPNGKKLAEIYTQSNSTGGVTQIIFESYDFNNTTGAVSNYTNIGGFTCSLGNCWAYGTEFSPDGTILYYTYHGNLYQVGYCQSPPSVNGSIVSIENSAINATRASLQLGHDGKIYVANVGTSSLGVINNPNNFGNACNYNASAISLGTTVCQYGLPNFLTSYFEKPPITFTTTPFSLPNCLTAGFITSPTICAFTGYTVSTYKWFFGDPASGSANSSTLATPVHTYPAPGAYTVDLIVGYSCGRNDTVRKTITVLNPPVLAVSSTSSICGPSTTTISASGGIGPYSYTWMPGSQTGSVATNLSLGVYSVTINDLGGGCSGVTTVTVNTSIINGTVVANPVCATASSGSAAILASGGSGSYNYTWSSGTQTTSVVSGLSIGMHTVTILDAVSQCSLTKTFNISQSPPLSLLMVVSGQSACVGSSITLFSSPSGGTPGYSYSWAGGPSTVNYTVSPATGGTYIHSLTVTDAQNCSITNTVDVTFISNPVLSFSGGVTCLNSPGNIIAMGASSYTWLPSSYVGNTYTSNPVSTTIYTVIGKIAWCTSTATTALIVNPLPVINMTSNSPLCAGQSLTLSGSGGISYQWTGPSGFSSAIQSTVLTATSGHNGMYYLTVTDANLCKASSSVSVTVHPLPLIGVTATKPVCIGQSNSLTASGALSYTWNTGISGSVIVVSPGTNTTYTVSGTNIYGCVNNNTITVKVIECTGLHERNNKEILKIYPNPSSGLLTIETELSTKIFIYNQLGSIALEGAYDKGKHFIDISALSDGIYLLKYTDKDDNHVLKLIKSQ